LSRSHSLRVNHDGSVEVFCGVDVARETHHAVAVDRSGRRLADRALPNDETALRDLFTELAGHGRLLVVVDQPASIGALAIAVARSMGVEVGYLPGLAMRRIADLYPGEGKTDARDAFVIADAARTLPHALRRVGPDEQTVTALGVLAGYDADLAAEATRLTNRLHDALLHVHPALERLLGKHFRRRGVLELLATAGTPARLRALGEDGLRQAIAVRSPRMARRLPAKILTALDDRPSSFRPPSNTGG
jgi:Arc/MetJ family transcription regulator